MQRKPTVRRRFNSAQRERLLAAYRQSDLTQREFAVRHGISLSCLVVWLRKSSLTKATAAPLPFIQLPGGLPGAAAARAAYKIQFPSGHSLEVASGFLPEELDLLCQVLRAL